MHQIELELQNRELRETQQRLEASRARYAELYDRAPIGYGRLDAHGVVTDLNLMGAALMGHERDALFERPLAAAIGAGLPFLEHLRKCAHARASLTMEVETGEASAKRILEITTLPEYSLEARLEGFHISIVDITERRSAEDARGLLAQERSARAQADAANQMKDEFLGIVSHELRTPLNALRGWTELLTRRSRDPEALHALEVMDRNGRALTRIVEDILDISRIVNGKLDLDLQKADLAEVVRNAIEQVRPSLEAKQIQLEQSLVEPCSILGDSQRLQQVVSNLLSNSIKFTPKLGTVEVTLCAAPGVWQLAVRDSGCGIDAADLPHIFERFRQADGSSKRHHGGLGLGLAIARSIVEGHGGTLCACSEGRGLGAVFNVDLPNRPWSSPPGPQRELVAGDIAGVRVLCVDDDPDSLALTAVLLQTFGAEVKTASSADRAMMLLGTFLPDVLISDLAMPGRDGFEFIERIRLLAPPLRDIPVVALTAYARTGDAERTLRAGFAKHLSKPIDGQTLCAAVAEVARIARHQERV